ncbi:hypothetical protein PR048_018463 [Dryococelus australis]|uniref:Uncharacterized protein n=1 Tax=Dryococelus australis TaxID=614101 RepID=A0ABQ9HCH2_9NEOP|nr:hypothetical protein PR048_018463 [Dryococelus australis]
MAAALQVSGAIDAQRLDHVTPATYHQSAFPGLPDINGSRLGQLSRASVAWSVLARSRERHKQAASGRWDAENGDRFGVVQIEEGGKGVGMRRRRWEEGSAQFARVEPAGSLPHLPPPLPLTNVPTTQPPPTASQNSSFTSRARRMMGEGKGALKEYGTNAQINFPRWRATSVVSCWDRPLETAIKETKSRTKIQKNFEARGTCRGVMSASSPTGYAFITGERFSFVCSGNRKTKERKAESNQTSPCTLAQSSPHSSVFTPSRSFTPRTPRPPSPRNLLSTSVPPSTLLRPRIQPDDLRQRLLTVRLWLDRRRPLTRNFSKCRVAPRVLVSRIFLPSSKFIDFFSGGRRRGFKISFTRLNRVSGREPNSGAEETHWVENPIVGRSSLVARAPNSGAAAGQGLEHPIVGPHFAPFRRGKSEVRSLRGGRGKRRGGLVPVHCIPSASGSWTEMSECSVRGEGRRTAQRLPSIFRTGDIPLTPSCSTSPSPPPPLLERSSQIWSLPGHASARYSAHCWTGDELLARWHTAVRLGEIPAYSAYCSRTRQQNGVTDHPHVENGVRQSVPDELTVRWRPKSRCANACRTRRCDHSCRTCWKTSRREMPHGIEFPSIQYAQWYRGATVAERLACSPPTKAIRVQSPAGPLRIFACGNRPRRRLWPPGFLGVLPFPPPSHSGAAPYSPQSPTSALNTSVLRAVQISSLTHSGIGMGKLLRLI